METVSSRGQSCQSIRRRCCRTETNRMARMTRRGAEPEKQRPTPGAALCSLWNQWISSFRPSLYLPANFMPRLLCSMDTPPGRSGPLLPPGRGAGRPPPPAARRSRRSRSIPPDSPSGRSVHSLEHLAGLGGEHHAATAAGQVLLPLAGQRRRFRRRRAGGIGGASAEGGGIRSYQAARGPAGLPGRPVGSSVTPEKRSAAAESTMS